MSESNDLGTQEANTSDGNKNAAESSSNTQAYKDILNCLMTNPKTGERMSYAESRMMYG